MMFTVVFNGQLGSIEGNPFRLATVFGHAQTISHGDVVAEADKMRDLLAAIQAHPRTPLWLLKMIEESHAPGTRAEP